MVDSLKYNEQIKEFLDVLPEGVIEVFIEDEIVRPLMSGQKTIEQLKEDIQQESDIPEEIQAFFIGVVDTEYAKIVSKKQQIALNNKKKMAKLVDEIVKKLPKHNPIDKDEIVEETIKRIKLPKVIHGKDSVVDYGKIVRSVLSLLPTPEKGDDRSPDTPEQIAEKINFLKQVINPNAIEGLENIYSDVETLKKKSKDMSRGGGASIFTQLADVPYNYKGQSGKVLKVNTNETGLIFGQDNDAQDLQSVTNVGSTTDKTITALGFIGDGSGLTNLNIDLSGYVPYTAGGDINLGTHKFIGDGSLLTNLPIDLSPYWKNDGTSTATSNWDIGAYNFSANTIYSDTDVNLAGRLIDVVPASVSTFIDIDGNTNPYNSTSALNGVVISRKRVGAYPDGFTSGISNLHANTLTIDMPLSVAKDFADFQHNGLNNTVSNVSAVGSAVKYFQERNNGMNNSVSRSGTLSIYAPADKYTDPKFINTGMNNTVSNTVTLTSPNTTSIFAESYGVNNLVTGTINKTGAGVTLDYKAYGTKNVVDAFANGGTTTRYGTYNQVSTTGGGTNWSIYNVGTPNSRMGDDLAKTMWGTDQDSSAYYDATNLVINPRETGSGILDVKYGQKVSAMGTTLGTEKLTNGSFTGSSTGWILGTGWQYNTNLIRKNLAGTGTLSQPIASMAIPFKLGEVDVVTFTISNWTVGSVLVTCGGATIGTYSANGIYTSTPFRVTDTTQPLTFTPVLTTARYYIDTVSLKQAIDGTFSADGTITGYNDINANGNLSSLNLTAGRVPFIGAGGVLVDDTDMTFATDTLTVTKIQGSTSIRVLTANGYISSDGSVGGTANITMSDGSILVFKDGLYIETLLP